MSSMTKAVSTAIDLDYLLACVRRTCSAKTEEARLRRAVDGARGEERGPEREWEHAWMTVVKAAQTEREARAAFFRRLANR